MQKRAYKRKDTWVCGIMIDLNGFKAINDTYGHAEGDTALILAAGLLKNAFGEYGVVTRYAGDEFVVILNTADEQLVQSLIARAKENFEEVNGTHDKPYRLSASMGYAIADLHTETIADFMNRIDRQMYQDKLGYYAKTTAGRASRPPRPMTPDSKQRKRCDTYDVVRPDRGAAGNVRADHHPDAPGVAEAPPPSGPADPVPCRRHRQHSADPVCRLSYAGCEATVDDTGQTTLQEGVAVTAIATGASGSPCITASTASSDATGGSDAPRGQHRFCQHRAACMTHIDAKALHEAVDLLRDLQKCHCAQKPDEQVSGHAFFTGS